VKVRLDFVFVLFIPLVPLASQEADSGIDISATISGEPIYAHELTESPRNGSALDAAFRAVVYPILKLDEHWTIAGAVQFNSEPYFTENFSAPAGAVAWAVSGASVVDVVI